jgi:hypothetical protein
MNLVHFKRFLDVLTFNLHKVYSLCESRVEMVKKSQRDVKYCSGGFQPAEN